MFNRAVFDALPSPCVVIDREGIYKVFNMAAVSLLGARPMEGEVAGSQSYVKLFHLDGVTPLDRDEMPLVRALAGEHTQATELVYKTAAFPDGRRMTVNAGPIRDDGGDIIGALAILFDVTDRVVAEDRLARTQGLLERSQKVESIGRLAGAVAHDFNNLLTVILSFSQMLEETLPSDGPDRADVSQIRRAAERGAALTRQLLMLSRQSAVEPKLLDPAEVVEGLRGIIRRLVGAQVELVIQASPGLCVHADRGQLEQVVINLAVNARDAMNDRGRLAIDVSRVDLDAEAAKLRELAAGAYVELAVTDTGAGMDAETQRRIFEPFFTTKESGKGTGLGLAIVHGIVGQRGGAVTVYSELGHGTTFRVYLPVMAGTVVVEQVTSEAPVRLPAITVLLLEDDEQVRAVTSRTLTAAGCTVIETTTVDEARRRGAVHEGEIAVLVTDAVLTDGRGDLLARDMVQLRPGLRVVFATGYAGSALASIGDHPAQMLSKPFTPDELRRAVAAVLEITPPTTASMTAPRAMRVLIVDDDEVLRRTVVRVVRRIGADVVEASSGRAGVAALATGTFDVVLSDVNMPDGDGLELLRSIRRIDLDIPVILATGMPRVEAAAEAIEYGAFRYLTKPFDSEALVKTLQHAARMHALARLRREANLASGPHARLVADRAGLEVRYDAAIEAMWMAYQPIIDARTGANFGVEALLRSDDPMMPNPLALLDAATKLDRIQQLGRRVRATVASAPVPRELAVFINLHPDDLFDPDLVAETAALSAIAPYVILEITERASLPTSTVLTKRVAQLREMGFRLAIDDIGAGYSGLTSFADLEPEIVKIDMSLVRDVHLSTVRQRIIRSLCTLCHDTGTLVVGEGVETESERATLVDLGCDLLQGYLFGRPSRELPR